MTALLWSLARPHRAALVLASVLLLLDTGVMLAVPGLAGLAAQRVLGPAGDAAGRLVAVIIVLLAAGSLVRFLANVVVHRTTTRLVCDVRARVHDHVQRLPLAFHHAHRHGDLVALLSHESSQLAAFIGGTMLGWVPAIFGAVGAVVLMARFDARLAAVIALLVPLFFLAAKLVGRRLRPQAVRLQEADAAAVAVAAENLEMVPAIKAFTGEAHAAQRLREALDTVRTRSDAQARAFSAMEPAFQFVAMAAAVVLLWLATQRLASGQLAAGALVSLVLYGAVLARPIARLAAAYGQTLMALGTLERLARVLRERPESPEPQAAVLPALAPVRCAIVFEDVSFRYEGRGPLLQGFSLAVRAGEKLAITGPNGCGKSTLAALLLRLYAPQGGRILIDGVNAAAVSLQSLRAQIALVPQHVLLFNGTVRDNIVFGRPGASDDEIREASRLAQVEAFAAQLPQGLDTWIGDAGVRLSGGQRQRIALARALLKRAPVLVLDEPTAMFDPEAEEAFVRMLATSLPATTVLLITHRPASLRVADRTIALPAAGT